MPNRKPFRKMRVGLRDGEFVVSFKPPITGQDLASMPSPGGQPFQTIEKISRSTVLTFSPDQLQLGEAVESIEGYSRRVIEHLGNVSLEEHLYQVQDGESPFDQQQ